MIQNKPDANHYGTLVPNKRWNCYITVVRQARRLREAQKAYMADRGNDALGKAVGEAAKELDLGLADLDSTEETVPESHAGEKDDSKPADN